MKGILLLIFVIALVLGFGWYAMSRIMREESSSQRKVSVKTYTQFRVEFLEMYRQAHFNTFLHPLREQDIEIAYRDYLKNIEK